MRIEIGFVHLLILAPSLVVLVALAPLNIALSKAGGSSDPAQPRTKYDELMAKAANLALQHDRVQSTQILRNALVALESENLKDKEVVEEKLKAALNNISNFFFEDKTQQLSELAQSLQFQDRKLAMSRLEEALRLEPDNLSLLIQQARLLLGENQCQAARTHAEKALAINPGSEEARLSLAQSYYCEGNTEKLFSLVAALEDKQTKRMYWDVLKGRSLHSIQAIEKSVESAEAAIKIDPKYPEPYFLLFRATEQHNGLDAETKTKLKSQYEPKEAYLRLCESLSVRARRTYSQDPWLCNEAQKEEINASKEALTKSPEE